MHRFQALLSARLASVAMTTGQKGKSCFTSVKPCELITPSLYQRERRIHTSTFNFAATNLAHKETIMNRTYGFIHYHCFKKYVYRAKGFLLYRYSLDSVDHITFISDFQMPDTFFSWFLITELHVWMLMVRLMTGDKDLMEVRKNLVAAMWQDLDVRRQHLGNVRGSTIKDHIQEMGKQFNAAIIGYDEGLLGNDQTLAGAVWRRFFQTECNNPELVEKLVIYIRKTINVLDKVPNEVFMTTTKIQWPNHRNL